MNKDYLVAYFDVLCDAIRTPDGPLLSDYYAVLMHLHCTEFKPTLVFDRNRVIDALDYRAKFIDDRDTPVGIFELMVSLANRIETETMGGTSEHNRTADWFWCMMASLGLLSMTDDVYDPRAVDEVIDRFIYREYSPNGDGGLFITTDRTVDLRNEEIWYQAALFLNDVLRSEGVLES